MDRCRSSGRSRRHVVFKVPRRWSRSSKWSRLYRSSEDEVLLVNRDGDGWLELRVAWPGSEATGEGAADKVTAGESATAETGVGLGDGAGTLMLYVQGLLALRHRRQDGRASSHLTLRDLQVRQPKRDFVWDRIGGGRVSCMAANEDLGFGKLRQDKSIWHENGMNEARERLRGQEKELTQCVLDIRPERTGASRPHAHTR